VSKAKGAAVEVIKAPYLAALLSCSLQLQSLLTPKEQIGSFGEV
jgi:hypothetical protein